MRACQFLAANQSCRRIQPAAADADRETDGHAHSRILAGLSLFRSADPPTLALSVQSAEPQPATARAVTDGRLRITAAQHLQGEALPLCYQCANRQDQGVRE